MSRLSRLLFPLCFISLLILGGCSKDEKQTETPKVKATSVDQFTRTVVGSLPDNTVGFMHFDFSHPAYLKLKQSTWGQPLAWDFAESIKMSGGDGKSDPFSLLTKAGFDVNKSNLMTSLFTEAALFVAPGKSNIPNFGVLFRLAKGSELAARIPQLRKALEADGIKTADLGDKQYQGFSWTMNDPQKPDFVANVFLALQGERGVVTNDVSTLSKLLATDTKAVPTFLTAPEFLNGMATSLSEDTRYSVGYLNLSGVLAEALRQDPTCCAGMTPDTIAFRTVSAASGMNETPQTEANIVVDQSRATPTQKAWLAALTGSSSAGLLGAQPAQPIVYLSLDGKVIKQLKDEALRSAGPALAAPYAVLDSVTRIALAAQMSSTPQALFPVPDILLSVQTAEATRMQEFVKSLTQQSGLPLQWNTKTVADVPVQFALSPMGIGVYMAEVKGALLVSSSEGQMASALSSVSSGKGEFVARLSDQGKSQLRSDASVAHLYLSFAEIAKVVETMGGLLSAYAPQDPNAQQITDPKHLAALRSMGVMVGSITTQEDRITLRSSYEKPGEQVALSR